MDVNPSIEVLQKLANHFGTTVAVLIGESSETNDTQLRRIVRSLGELTARDRSLIEDMIKAMKKRPLPKTND